jgi:hypothetical protein
MAVSLMTWRGGGWGFALGSGVGVGRGMLRLAGTTSAVSVHDGEAHAGCS